MLPYYLKKKLLALGINDFILKQYGYLKVFKWLKDANPSLSLKALFDLYSFYHDYPLNNLTTLNKQQIIAQYKKLLPCYLPLSAKCLKHYLAQAEQEAQLALKYGEVPIGAIIVKDNKVIARGFNQTLMQQDIMQHAEIVAITKAQKILANHRLTQCDLYVTLEPCVMCIGAILNSRIRRVVFGGLEPKTGAIISRYKILANQSVNHHTEAIGPINTLHYASLVQGFFQQKRS